MACGITKTLGHLTAQGVENFRVLARHFAKFLVTDLGHFAFGLRPYPGAALLLTVNGLEQPQLAKEIARVEVGDDHFMTVIVFNDDGDRPLDDERQCFGPVASADDVAFCGEAAALAVHQQLVYVLDLCG